MRILVGIACVWLLFCSVAFGQVGQQPRYLQPLVGGGGGSFAAPASQANSFSPTGTSFNAAAFTAPANCINIVAVGTSGSTTVALTDSLGSTYNQFAGSPGNETLYWAAITSAQAGNVIHVTFGTSVTAALNVACITGANMAAPIDTTATNNASGAPSWTTTVSPTVLFGVIGPNGGTVSGLSPNSWISVGNSGDYSALVYNLTVASSTVSALTFTCSGCGGGIFGSVWSAVK